MKKIEAFLSRELTNQDRFGFELNEDGSIKSINIWDVKDKERPTPEELNSIPDYPEDGKEYYYNKEQNIWVFDNKKESEKKMVKLRQIRDILLQSSIWIQQRHLGELQGIEAGLTTKPTTLTTDQYNQWLLYWQQLRDLPETVNLEDYNIDDIVESNSNIFPVIPNFEE